jgi:hypothetical protein
MYSYKGKYPTCTKCYLAWEKSPDNREYFELAKRNLAKGQACKNDFLFAEYFERWLGIEKPEVVQFT